MTNNKDYYKILGVTRDADDSALKSAYRRLSKELHPDRQQGKTDAQKKEAEEKFKDVTEAYSVLSDKDKRRHYDTFGTVDGFGHQSSMSSDDIEEFIKQQFGGGFGFPFGGGQRQQTYKGADRNIQINVSIADLYNKKPISQKYTVWETCTDCHGTGSADGKSTQCPYCHGSGVISSTQRHGNMVFTQQTPCPHCHGTGTYLTNPCKRCGGSGIRSVEKTLDLGTVYIDMMGIRFVKRGMGDAPKNGKGMNGDLYYQMTLVVNNQFTVDEHSPMNIITTLEVPVLTCILGGEVSVIHVDGKKYNFTIEQGTVDGRMYRLKGKGLSSTRGTTGDLCVKIKIKMPKQLSKDDVKLLDKLKKSSNFAS